MARFDRSVAITSPFVLCLCLFTKAEFAVAFLLAEHLHVSGLFLPLHPGILIVFIEISSWTIFFWTPKGTVGSPISECAKRESPRTT